MKRLLLCLLLCGCTGCVELNKSFYLPDSWNATAYMNPDSSLNTYAVGLNYPFPFRRKQTP